MRRTKAEAEQTRNDLLDAAEQLFDQRGVSSTSLAYIATIYGFPPETRRRFRHSGTRNADRLSKR